MREKNENGRKTEDYQNIDIKLKSQERDRFKYRGYTENRMNNNGILAK